MPFVGAGPLRSRVRRRDVLRRLLACGAERGIIERGQVLACGTASVRPDVDSLSLAAGDRTLLVGVRRDKRAFINTIGQERMFETPQTASYMRGIATGSLCPTATSGSVFYA